MRRYLMVLSLLAVPLSAAAAPFTIAVDAHSITITNASPGGNVVLFSCARTSAPHSIRVTPETNLLHDSGSGVIQFTPAQGVPPRSVWVAVDEATGAFATGARPGYPLLVASIDSGKFRKDAANEIASLAADFTRLMLLVVRPGTGAWTETVFDGKEGDRDGAADGHIELAFENCQTIDGKDKAPKHLQNGDVVAAIDPGHFDVFVTQVGK